jgi:hypothetical protein
MLLDVNYDIERALQKFPEKFHNILHLFKEKNCLCSFLELSSEIQLLALHYPEDFLSLQENKALTDWVQLHLEVQQVSLHYYLMNFLKLREENAYTDLLRLSPYMQKRALVYSENFLKLRNGNAFNDLFRLASADAQEYALLYPERFLQLKERDALNDLFQLTSDHQKDVIEYSEGFLKLKTMKSLDLLGNQPKFILQRMSLVPESSSLSMLRQFMTLSDERNITQLHRDARNGNLKRIDQCIEEIPEDSVVLNPLVYFSSKTLADCRAPSQISQIDQISLDQFAFPFVVAQNYCNTHVKMKDGNILILQRTDAKKVYNSLVLRSKTEGIWQRLVYELQKMTKISSPPTLENNAITVYLNPIHGFLALSCSSCAGKERGSFHGAMGFQGRYGDQRGSLFFSDHHQLLKATIYISDEQARAVWEKQNSLKKDASLYDYGVISNCVDFVVQTTAAAGIHNPYEFFTQEQLAYESQHFSQTNTAIQYARFKYNYNAPIDCVVSAIHLATLFVVCNTAKVFYKVSKACLSSGYRYITKKQENSMSDTSHAVSEKPDNGTPTYIKNGLINIACHGIRYAVKTITGADNPVLAIFTKHSLFASAFLAYEAYSAEKLNKHTAPSLWNKNISLYVASGLASSLASVAGRLAYSGMRRLASDELLAFAVSIVFSCSVFFFLVALNESRKFLHSITEAPNIDGMSLE